MCLPLCYSASKIILEEGCSSTMLAEDDESFFSSGSESAEPERVFTSKTLAHALQTVERFIFVPLCVSVSPLCIILVQAVPTQVYELEPDRQ